MCPLLHLSYSPKAPPPLSFPCTQRSVKKNTATNLKPIGFPLTLVTANPAPQDGQPLIKFPPHFFAFLSLSIWVYVLFLYRFSSLNHAQEK